MEEGAGKDLNRRARLQARALSYGSATPDHSEPYPLCEFCLVLELNVYYQHVLSSFVLSSSSFFSVLRNPLLRRPHAPQPYFLRSVSIGFQALFAMSYRLYMSYVFILSLIWQHYKTPRNLVKKISITPQFRWSNLIVFIHIMFSRNLTKSFTNDLIFSFFGILPCCTYPYMR